jgi:hypothetical protein
MSNQTSILAVLIHAVVFYFLLAFVVPLIRRAIYQGFQSGSGADSPPCQSDLNCAASGLKDYVCDMNHPEAHSGFGKCTPKA